MCIRRLLLYSCSETSFSCMQLPRVQLPSEFLALLSNFRFSTKMEETASTIVQTMGAGDGSYMCAHWRTGDWSFPMSLQVPSCVHMLQSALSAAMPMHWKRRILAVDIPRLHCFCPDNPFMHQLQVSQQIAESNLHLPSERLQHSLAPDVSSIPTPQFRWKAWPCV
jgi:hypothetical protein